MPAVVCPQCGHMANLPGGRGARIAGSRCRACGSSGCLTPRFMASRLGLRSTLDIYDATEGQRREWGASLLGAVPRDERSEPSPGTEGSA